MAEKSHHHPIYDVIVIGGGAIGLSAAYYATKMNKSVLLLEQANKLFNEDGSSPGKTRMWRVMHSQEKLALLAQQTVDLWQDLQKLAETHDPCASKLITPADMLWLGDPNLSIAGPEGDFTKAKEVSEKTGFPLKTIAWKDLPNYGFHNVPPNYVGYSGLEDGKLLAGVIDVPLLGRTLEAAAVKSGLKLQFNTHMQNIKVNAHEVVITDAKGTTYRAKKVIIAAGCWANELLQHFGVKLKLTIWEMTSFYWKSKVDRPYPMWISFANEPTPEHPDDLGFRYGFPEDPKGYVRICSTNPKILRDDMSQVTHKKDMEEREMLKRWLEQHMPSIDTNPDEWTNKNISTCLTNYTPDGNYVLDFVPNTHNKVVLFTAGWAMKFVPMFGKVLAELAIHGKVADNLQPLIADFYIPSNYTDREGLRVPLSTSASTASAKTAMLAEAPKQAPSAASSVLKMLV